MFSTSEKFLRVQQQFKEWTPFEQLYATVDLTRTFQSSYRYFLLQLFQANIQYENNDMFNHTVDDANASDIVSCLLSNTLDKILSTLQLYLPLISIKTINKKLLDAYRDVLIHLDANLVHPTKFSYTEQQIINFSQQILFFIQTNPNLQILSTHIPKLIHLVQTNKFPSDEQQQQYHQPLQRYSSTRSSQQVQSIMNYSSENSQLTICQQLKRHETNDSGVDLTEPAPIQNFLSSHNQQQSTQNKHSFVVKTASSPIPEHATLNVPARIPLKGVLSAPSPPTTYSNYQQQKHRSTLAKSDEDENESQQIEDFVSDKTSTTDNSKPLGQFYSLRYRNIKHTHNDDNVSQYLGVDANSAPIRNTFTQPNTGMRDVPKWLKHLRLHKYDVCFSQMTYDQMMNLTMDQLKKLGITDGACSKILLNIKKLKERSILLNQCLIDLDNGQVDLQNIVQQLNELMLTPIRSRQLEIENNSDEDLAALIIQLLDKIYHQLNSSSSSDICNTLLGLFDRCYKHDAFTVDQRYHLLQWRGRLSNMLQSLGKIEYKTIQSVYSHTAQQRRITKPSVRPIKSSNGAYYSNYPSNTVPLSKFSSEPQNNNLSEPNLIRRPTRSPTLIYPTNEESNETNLQTSFSSITSTPQRNNGAYLANNQHQALTRKASIDPYGETNKNDRTKLCKTFSDPNKMRFANPTQLNQMKSHQIQQQNLFRMISTPYSQQRQFISRSPPSSTLDTSTSPIKKSYSDNERSDYYGNSNDITPSSNASNPNDAENTDDQRHNNTEFESFCRQITESAISDDVNDSSINIKEETSDVSNIKQPSNNSTDIEQ